ncbi:hypothetical protein [Umezawaea sp. NPDC059074]|uniref:hypothetical protein n=1 Tax=Umezawaea sp. NPDC059074 TaxID=3346716 RepID=UPI0036A326BE
MDDLDALAGYVDVDWNNPEHTRAEADRDRDQHNSSKSCRPTSQGAIGCTGHPAPVTAPSVLVTGLPTSAYWRFLAIGP